MSFRKNVKQNIPRVDLQSYILLIAGTYKAGKTRLWKELLEYMYPDEPDAGLLIAFETGYKSWKLKSFIDMAEYRAPDEIGRNGKVKVKTEIEMDADKWVYFKKDIVGGLVQESKEGRTSKVIGFDTVDRLIDCASAYIVNEANIKYPNNGFTSIQELSESKIYKENVWNNLYDELKRPVDNLRGSGYGIINLAWTKEKTTELIDGVKYNSIELMMNATCRKVFQSQADLICCLHNEVKATDKTGKELTKNAESKSGKEIATNFHESQTFMYFRESNYISIAGGRFVNLPEKVPYGIKEFVDVFKEAVEGQLDGNESIEELRKVEIEQREEKAQAFSEEVIKEIEQEQEEEKAQALIETAKELIETITAEIKLFDGVTINKVIVPKFKEIFGGDYRKVEDVDKLTVGLNYVKELPKVTV
jgi:hypothetical protein